MSLVPSRVSEHIRSCLGYRFEDSFLVIENKCRESFELRAVIVNYYVTVKREESAYEQERLAARREISERISVGKRLAPGGSIEIYFGPVENIVSVYVVVEYAGGEYRVEVPHLRQTEEAGEGASQAPQ